MLGSISCAVVSILGHGGPDLGSVISSQTSFWSDDSVSCWVQILSSICWCCDLAIRPRSILYPGAARCALVYGYLFKITDESESPNRTGLSMRAPVPIILMIKPLHKIQCRSRGVKYWWSLSTFEWRGCSSWRKSRFVSCRGDFIRCTMGYLHLKTLS